MKISVNMGGKQWGGYPFSPKEISLSRWKDTVFINIKSCGSNVVDGASMTFSVDELYPLSRAIHNILEGGIEKEELSYQVKT